MSNIGRARNARINQAARHADDLLVCLKQLQGRSKNEHIDEKDAWADARNAVEQAAQCFHEANAYNNAMNRNGADAAMDDLEKFGAGHHGVRRR